MITKKIDTITCDFCGETASGFSDFMRAYYFTVSEFDGHRNEDTTSELHLCRRCQEKAYAAIMRLKDD